MAPKDQNGHLWTREVHTHTLEHLLFEKKKEQTRRRGRLWPFGTPFEPVVCIFCAEYVPLPRISYSVGILLVVFLTKET